MRLPDAALTLERDLRAVFGTRLHALMAYADASGVDRSDVLTLAVVDDLGPDDLRACADRVGSWHAEGLATPLLVTAQEFERSLDVFPFEFGAILSDYVLVAGDDPFIGLRANPADMRRACEVQARSHLLHLREGFLETKGRGDAIADLLLQSAAPLAALVRSVARLYGEPLQAAEAAETVERALELPIGCLREIVALVDARAVASDRARRLFPPYLTAVERLTNHIDQWNA